MLPSTLLSDIATAEAHYRRGNLGALILLFTELSRDGYHLSDPAQLYGRPHCFECGALRTVIYRGALVLSICRNCHKETQ